MKLKKIFSVITISIFVCSVLIAAGLRFGMTGAVKAKVKELDKKVREKKAATVTATLAITSIKQGVAASSPSLIQKGFYKGVPAMATSFTANPTTSYGWINSGAPDYIKVTLNEISVQSDVGRQVAWSGSKELYIDGSGDIDTGGITLTFSTTTAKITKVHLTFETVAKIKGTLTENFNIAPASATHTEALKTFYTKAAYPYDAVAHTGGAANFTPYETGPAEETSVSLGGVGSETNIELPISGDINFSTPTLTILVDIDRMLRFYDGLNGLGYGGVNPVDPSGKAYFFCHSLFRYSIAAFLGTPGREKKGTGPIFSGMFINP